ncbi:SDR family NAD(P)-dependent oxidoreductase [Planomonospora sp. ID91781]|uniref:SDR family NAD(P)-dependent oxidoreductase n=1 Tax=Planomonospora sp. ID91781 TaxID=2738135 RepID=UPI0018C35C25|nr:SDR family NAD(P)-dependent oxidoreductase [Planomonospora sp. ID91781]MBG0822829.1 SDR family NAD(P)-dependent oxidoreductase [Planomonospora sp. ID91781]
MRTIVITGGTDGIGRALALRRLRGGDRVVALGSGPVKGERFLEEARRLGAGDRAVFRRADLASAAVSRAVAAELAQAYPVVDALVLGAYRHHPDRVETAEGFERTFALYVLSRHLLAEGLRGSLERADSPVVLSLCGVGTRAGRIDWDDLQQARGSYRSLRATMQGARANDLLGVSFAERHAGGRTRYVLYNPGFVATGMAEPLRQPTRGLVRAMARLFARSADETARQVAEVLDRPPAAPLSGFFRGGPVDLGRPGFDREAAARLHGALQDMLGETVRSDRPGGGGAGRREDRTD